MLRLVFPLIFTAFPLAALAFQEQLSLWQHAIYVLMAGIGALFIRSAWRDGRRRRSLRMQTEGAQTTFVWTEHDGTEHRSTRDPRPDWDARDSGDGDGDGDGGD